MTGRVRDTHECGDACGGRVVARAIPAVLLCACAESAGTSILAPAGPAAARIAALWWVLLAVCVVIYVVFCAAAFYAILHRRRASEPPPDHRTVRWVLIAGAAVPALIITGLGAVTFATLRATTSSAGAADVIVEVHGRLWWWEVVYPAAAGQPAAITANEIRVPVGESVEIRLHSDNVIHSFWVPRLHGKLDLVPGKVNVLRIQADEPGVFRGFCAEYCGLQHARMGLLVIAEPRERFDEWLRIQRMPALETPQAAGAATPAGAAFGRSAFIARCGSCHTVRGTLANGTEGPDLTHVASRLTLAAATLPNTVAALGGWIVHPQSIKPGNKMPNVDLPPAEFHAILAYVQTLR